MRLPSGNSSLKNLPSLTRIIFAATLTVAAVSPCAGTMLYFPPIKSVALPSRASFRDVARLGRIVSGTRSFCWMILRSSLETTFKLGTFNKSVSASAKLSPTQLNSALSDVFSNGKIITVSPLLCALTETMAIDIKKIVIKIFRIILLTSRSKKRFKNLRRRALFLRK